MTDGGTLSRVAEQLIPDYLRQFYWEDVWQRPIDTGTSFEWVTFAAILAVATRRGWEVSFPLLNEFAGTGWFVLRNEMPTHHNAQPGHASHAQHRHNLGDRFLQAFIPKAILQKDGRWISLFREGCPYHRLLARTGYKDRPDILFLNGRPTSGFPRLVDNEVHFSYNFSDDGIMSGIVQVINAINIRAEVEGIDQIQESQMIGVVECSVNKSISIAEPQIQRYIELFTPTTRALPVVLVTGNALATSICPNAVVDLSDNNTVRLVDAFTHAATLILDAFGL
jgi:hypothetical protein